MEGPVLRIKCDGHGLEGTPSDAAEFGYKVAGIVHTKQIRAGDVRWQTRREWLKLAVPIHCGPSAWWV